MTVDQFLRETYPWWAIAAGLLSAMVAFSLGRFIYWLRNR